MELRFHKDGRHVTNENSGDEKIEILKRQLPHFVNEEQENLFSKISGSFDINISNSIPYIVFIGESNSLFVRDAKIFLENKIVSILSKN